MSEAYNPQTPSLHLEEVWKLRSPSDQQSALALFAHHTRLAFVFLMKSPLTSVLSILSVATVLFILGLLVALQRASFFGINDVTGELRASVFVKDSASEQEWQSLDKFIAALPGIRSQRKLDKAAALKELSGILGDDKQILSGLEIDNPLPASYELGFDVSYGSALAEYAQGLKLQNGVDSVVYDGQMAKLLTELGTRLRGAGKLSSLVLIGLTLFLIATTIRISLYHEREEIEIMGLVGAYPGFVQAPFIIGGALQGFLGFLVAVFSLSFMESRITGAVRSEQMLQFANINFSILGLQSALALAALGIGAGVVGSYLASRHFR